VTGHHELTDASLTALATGLGGPAVVAELVSSRLDRNLLLLKYVSENWREDRPILEAAVAALAQVQQRRPEVYQRLLGDPLVGAWLAHTVRQLRRHPGERLTDDLFQLGGLAAAAAMQAGVDADLIGQARRGRVTLPGWGEAVLADGTDGPVPIRVRQGQAVLGSSGSAVPADPPGWLPLRHLTARYADLACTVQVEDGNAYRNGYHVPPAGRLSDVEVDSWQQLYGQAWELLARHLPFRAAELATGLRTLVPLRDDDPGAARSGTARDSVGALGLTRPRSPEDFALTLVHEFQHSKLSAVLDLVTLYVPGGPERHFAPWRTDPRPTAGLIQGVYAFLGIADTWRGLRAVPALGHLASDQYSIAREQVHVALTSLEGSAELTAAGRRFTEGLRQALEPMMSEQLPERSVAVGRATLERLRESWGPQQIGRRTTA
jgi:HEXXH motif-containing protein